MRVGDRIVEIGDKSIDRFDDLRMYAAMRAGERTTVDIVREGRTLSVPLTIGEIREGDRFGNTYRVGRIGIGPTAPVWSRWSRRT